MHPKLFIHYYQYLRSGKQSCLLTNIFESSSLDGIHSKAIHARGRGGPQGREMSRIPHFLDNRLTDGGEVVSLTRSDIYISYIINLRARLK
jgi:hypothetical protein